VPRAENRYFNETIKPLLNRNNVEFVGEVNDRQKQTFLGNAAALLAAPRASEEKRILSNC
jgi:hypothetical protein